MPLQLDFLDVGKWLKLRRIEEIIDGNLSHFPLVEDIPNDWREWYLDSFDLEFNAVKSIRASESVYESGLYVVDEGLSILAPILDTELPHIANLLGEMSPTKGTLGLVGDPGSGLLNACILETGPNRWIRIGFDDETIV